MAGLDGCRVRLLVWVFAVVAAAPGAWAAPGAAEKRRVVGRNSAEPRVSLAEDELLVVELEARHSAGYAWTLGALDETRLALAGREQAPAKVVGGMDVQRLLFKGVASGLTTLSLVYRRPWAKATGGDPTYTVEVAVAGPYTGPYVPPAKVEARYAYAADGTLPAKYNLCDPGGGGYSRCTRVKDQGNCGGCWAFATAAVLENLLHLANPSASYDLSEQYLISCNNDGFSCEGGGEAAFSLYVDDFKRPPETVAGAVYTKDFPYQARDISCGSQAHPHHERLSSFKSLGYNRLPSVDTLKQTILAHGPVWAAVCADGDFSDYGGGSIFRGNCSDLNHAIVLVGWDDNAGDGYWLLRNSWSAGWGEDGHMRIAYGASGVGSDAYYVVYDGGGSANRPPVADAGADQSVKASATVTLDGSASRDPDGSIARYAWAQTGGSPTVTLAGAATARATFAAPRMPSSTPLGFTLTVTDGAGATSSATVTVTVTVSDNVPPIAEAGPAQTVDGGAAVTLDGSLSSDPDGRIASYAWVQTGGTTASLKGAAEPKPTFVAPAGQGGALTFTLTVKDDAGASATDTVSVGVRPSNAPPVADAGAAQDVTEGAAVTLDGSRSSDAEGAIATYAWTQAAGPEVQLSGAATARPTFTAPAGPANLTFNLTVTDGSGATADGSVAVLVARGAAKTPIGMVTAGCSSAGSPGAAAGALPWALLAWGWRRRAGRRLPARRTDAP